MTDPKPIHTHYMAAPGVLEGPYNELKIGEVTIEIFTRRGAKYMIARHHGIRAREAAEQRPPTTPHNPCLVALDWENEDMPGGPFVFARITDERIPRS